MFDKKIKIEKAIPQNIFINIFEHMRSQLNVRECSIHDFGNLEFTDIIFGPNYTRYEFNIDHCAEETKPSVIIGGETTKTVAYHTYRGYLKVIVDPSSQFPLFEFTAVRDRTAE